MSCNLQMLLRDIEIHENDTDFHLDRRPLIYVSNWKIITIDFQSYNYYVITEILQITAVIINSRCH